MAKKAPELSAKAVRDLQKPGHHAVGGVAGLLIRVSKTGAKSWILRVVVGTKRRDIGLGGFPCVTLTDARTKAREFREKINAGIDPVAERQAARAALVESQKAQATFKDVAVQAHRKRAQEFRNAKHSAQWISTLEKYAFPALANEPIADIEIDAVLAVLEKIWGTKPETASRVRQRIAAVFDHAIASGLRTKQNPATWQGRLKELLPAHEKVARSLGKGQNFPALPVDDLPRFMAHLQTRGGASARALEFAILTAARSGEVRGAAWAEINLDKGLWTIPAERMKAGKPHVVPLSPAAIGLLKALPKDGPLLFPGRDGQQLSDASLSALVKKMHAADLARGGHGYTDPMLDRIATPHGFRAAFKIWARQGGRFPDEWSELALAHVATDKTRAAYARGALIDERAGMMAQWALFCGGRGEEVTPIRRRAKA